MRSKKEIEIKRNFRLRGGGRQLAFIDIRRDNDVISFEPMELRLELGPHEFEIVVFRNFDRKAGHWIKPIDGDDDAWFEEKIARSTEQDVPQNSSLLKIEGANAPITLRYVCSMHPDRDPAETGSIVVVARVPVAGGPAGGQS
jgi:hypothetical protein